MQCKGCFGAAGNDCWQCYKRLKVKRKAKKLESGKIIMGKGSESRQKSKYELR